MTAALRCGARRPTRLRLWPTATANDRCPLIRHVPQFCLRETSRPAHGEQRFGRWAAPVIDLAAQFGAFVELHHGGNGARLRCNHEGFDQAPDPWLARQLFPGRAEDAADDTARRRRERYRSVPNFAAESSLHIQSQIFDARAEQFLASRNVLSATQSTATTSAPRRSHSKLNHPSHAPISSTRLPRRSSGKPN